MREREPLKGILPAKEKEKEKNENIHIREKSRVE